MKTKSNFLILSSRITPVWVLISGEQITPHYFFIYLWEYTRPLSLFCIAKFLHFHFKLLQKFLKAERTITAVAGIKSISIRWRWATAQVTGCQQRYQNGSFRCFPKWEIKLPQGSLDQVKLCSTCVLTGASSRLGTVTKLLPKKMGIFGVGNNWLIFPRG